jgi:hypothetical protein
MVSTELLFILCHVGTAVAAYLRSDATQPSWQIANKAALSAMVPSKRVPAPRPVPEYSDSSVCTHLWPIGKVFWDGHYAPRRMMNGSPPPCLEERLFTYRPTDCQRGAGYGSVATLIVDGNPSLRQTTAPIFLTAAGIGGYVLQLAAIRYASGCEEAR